MLGCRAPLATAASMTGSTELGPIQPQQDSAPLLDDSLFADEATRPGRFPARQEPRSGRRRMNNAASQPVQLTPLWEYVVRTADIMSF